MNRTMILTIARTTLLLLVTLPLSTLAFPRLHAQDAFDEPADADAFDEPNADDVDSGAPAADADPDAAGGTAPPPANLPPESDPAVLAVRKSNPTTPDKLGWAIQLMMKMNRPDEATRYVAQLLDLRPTDAALAGLYRKLGAPTFVRLGSDARLPRGRELAESVFAAAERVARDPARIQALLTRLSDPSADVRRVTIADLRGVGSSAVAPLVKALADPAQKGQHSAIRTGLVGMGDGAVAPLIGALGSPDEMQRAQIASVLGRIGSRESLPYLLGQAFAPTRSPTLRRASEDAVQRILGKLPAQAEAEQFVLRQAQLYLEGETPGSPDHLGLFEVWSWDAAQGASVARRHPPELASIAAASHLAHSLYAIDPNNVEYRRLFLIASLEYEQRVAGLDQPLPTDPGTAHEAARGVVGGVRAIEDAFQHAIRAKRVVAAAALANLLGTMGDDQLLHSENGRLLPLASALRHPDRRLRVAAVNAILSIDPQRSFPGASYVPETLGFLASNTGLRQVLVGDPNADRGQTVVGLLSASGFSAEAATNAADLFRRAAQQSDLELLLIRDSIQNPSLDLFLQTLRRDPRTADLPVGILARVEALDEARRIAELDPLCEAFPFEAGSSFVPGYTVAIDVPGSEAPTFEELIRVIRLPDRNRNLLLRLSARGRLFLDMQQYTRRFPLIQVERLEGRGIPGEERDYTLAIEGGETTGASLTRLVEFLREEPETKSLRLRILVFGSTLAEAEKLMANPKLDPIEVARGQTRDSRLADDIGVLRARSTNRVPYDERLRQAAVALEWLAKLSAEPGAYAFYDLSRQEEAMERSLYTPELAEQAARVLGQVGSTRAQRALVSLTSQQARPLAERQAAAAAFGTAVQRRGLLLTQPEILLQYDRYNASARADAGTQQVLASLLDTIEESTEPSP